MINNTFCKLLKCHRYKYHFYSILEEEDVGIICQVTGLGENSTKRTFRCYYLEANGAITHLWPFVDDPLYRSEIVVAAALAKARKVSVNDK